MRKAIALALCLIPTLAVASASVGGWARLPGGSFKSALQYEDRSQVRIAPFQLMDTPVTNAQFLAFVKQHPKWQRGKAAKIFAEGRYLQHWAGPTTLGAKVQPPIPVRMPSTASTDASAHASGSPARPAAVGLGREVVNGSAHPASMRAHSAPAGHRRTAPGRGRP